MSDDRLVLVDEHAVAKEHMEITNINSTTHWYGPQSPYFTREEHELPLLYRHIFLPNKL